MLSPTYISLGRADLNVTISINISNSPTNSQKFNTLINGGIYLLNKKFFYSLATQYKFSFEKDFLEKHYKNYEFYGFPFDEYFIDIGVPEDYERAKKEFEKFMYR